MVWLLGLRLVVWPVVAALLLWWLVTRRVPLRAPVGFGLWACFLAWTLLSVLTVDSTAVLASWAYRESLYLSATVVLVFVVSLRPSRLPTRHLALAVAWLTASSVGLAWLGLLVPDLAVTTVVEAVLPSSLTSSVFVQEQLLGRVSATAEFLGTVRPVAPYGYTNEWGAAMGMLVPLSVWAAGWMRTAAGRVAVWAVLAAALVPVVVSVNRGLWVSLVVAAAVVLGRSLVEGRARVLGVTALAVLAAAALVLASPLLDTVVGRWQRPNLGTRSTLAADALTLVAQSPYVGYGAPQPPIDAADTNGVSVGTHGQLFTLLVSHGIPGTVLYLGFFVAVLVATWHVSTRAVWAWASLCVLIVQSTFYNAIPVPLVLAFLAAGVCLRDVQGGASTSSRGVSVSDLAERPDEPARTVRPADYPRALRGRRWWLVVGLLVGALAGALLLPGASYRSTASVEVREGYVDLASPAVPGVANMVTEQQVAESSGVVAQVVEELDGAVAPRDLTHDGAVTSPPDSTTLVFSFSAASPALARRVVSTWSDAYLERRERSLTAALDAELADAAARTVELEGAVADGRQQVALLDPGTRRAETAELRLGNLTSQLNAARRTSVQLAALDVDPGRSLGAASDPGGPQGLSPLLSALLGGLGGLVLAVALAVLAARADRRLSGLGQVAGVPVWSEALGSSQDEADVEALVARLVLRHRRDGLRSVMLASLTGTEPDLAPDLVDGVAARGVDVELLQDPHRLLDPSAAPTGPGRGDGMLVVTADPVLEDPSTAVLAGQVDLVVLVADARAVDRTDVEGAVARLSGNDAVVEGLVVVGIAGDHWWRRSPAPGPGRGRRASARGRAVHRAVDDASATPVVAGTGRRDSA